MHFGVRKWQTLMQIALIRNTQKKVKDRFHCYCFLMLHFAYIVIVICRCETREKTRQNRLHPIGMQIDGTKLQVLHSKIYVRLERFLLYFYFVQKSWKIKRKSGIWEVFFELEKIYVQGCHDNLLDVKVNFNLAEEFLSTHFRNFLSGT